MSDRLKLEAVLDLQATARLAEQLRASSGSAQIDASGVTHLGALAAQLLASALSVPRASDGVFRIIEPSDAFKDGLRRLGFDPVRLCA